MKTLIVDSIDSLARGWCFGFWWFMAKITFLKKQCLFSLQRTLPFHTCAISLFTWSKWIPMWKFESLSVSFPVLVNDKVVFTLLLPGALLLWGSKYKISLSLWRKLPDKQNINPEQDLVGDGVSICSIDFLTFLFLLLFFLLFLLWSSNCPLHA